MAWLLERDDLLTAARALIGRQSGGVLVFQGEAGVGKTSLLDAAAAEAERVRVARARPVELERAFGFGVVRSLFEGLLDQRQRRRLPLGPGAAAARVLADVPAGERLPADVSHAVFYGLFWVLAMVAATVPVLLVVDDAQWADEQSLAWLAYLAPRLSELPVALLVAVRAAASTAGLANLLASEGARVERVPPLGPRAVEALVAREVGDEAGARLAEPALAASGGNPFLLGELLRAWREQGGEGALATTPRLRRLILGRVARAGADVVAVADAVAVLGGADVPVAAAAAATGLSPERVLEAAEALTREDILRPETVLTFVHPLIREAVYESMDPLRRAHAHRRAAAALGELEVDADAVAAQLLLAVPTGDAWATSVLRAAARRAVARGAPDAAAQLLRRALAEPPPADARAGVLCELGEVEARANDPQAETTLREALAASEGRRAGEVALALARLAIRLGRGLEAAEILRAARERAEREDPELALRIEAETFVAARTQPGGVVAPPQVPAHDRPDLAGRTPGERLLLACLTFEAAAGNAPAARIASLGERALAGGRLVREEGPEALMVHFAIAAQGYIDRYAAALGHLDAVMTEARRQGSIAGYVLARAWRADVLLRTGALAEAEADALDALALAAEHEIAIVAPLALFPLLLCQVEAGRLHDAEAALASHGFAGEIPKAGAFAGLRHARGRLHLAAGRTEDALADFLAAGEAFGPGTRTPAVTPWRSEAGLLLVAGGRTEEGCGLVEEELALARALGAPRPLGLALRARALLEPPGERVALLEPAVESLRAAGAQVELARALIDLGLAQLRAHERPAGRAALREALDLADRAGAAALADRAGRELVVAGARPRRRRITGRDALTPAELRVARLAAEGRSNREIAAELFLTPKTVETHLGRAYSKLGIQGRRDLAKALAAAD